MRDVVLICVALQQVVAETLKDLVNDFKRGALLLTPQMETEASGMSGQRGLKMDGGGRSCLHRTVRLVSRSFAAPTHSLPRRTLLRLLREYLQDQGKEIFLVVFILFRDFLAPKFRATVADTVLPRIPVEIYP
ncbi:hypothetical protein E2C01_047361 [Portunus trituberculatus]|uniref:Uncharacterized protein n=1 Tax=Portunus trituberculatus TaxID=210409 RepID=A0A5B7G8M4_PORTR|nr:hypothetical protein [Portunus trituberculatus]